MTAIEHNRSKDAAPILLTPAPAQHCSGRSALGGFALILAAALVGCGSDDDPPVATPAPPSADAPSAQPPANTPPPAGDLAPPGMVAGATLANGGVVYYSDTNANAIHDVGERAVIFNGTTLHYYELVKGPGPAPWDATAQDAAARGGHLLTGDSAGELEFVRSSFAFAAGTPEPTYGGLQITESDGTGAAWIGLMAAPGAPPAPATWNWVNVDGTPGGPPLAADAPWLVHFTFQRPSLPADAGGSVRAAMTGGNDLTIDSTPGVAPDPAPQQCLFDLQAGDLILSRYIIEYETAAAVTSVLK